MAVKRVLRIVLRVLFYTFLLTLPFNFQGFLAGVLFAKYRNDAINAGIQLYGQELDHFSWMEQWSVPGAPSFVDFKDNASPFFLPQLRMHDWTSKLGLTIPHQHLEYLYLEAPIDQLVSFESAVRDVSCHVGLPTEYWVYISSLAMPSVFPWDQTFVELLGYHEMHPLSGNTSFAYVDCADSPFLCHIWQVQYPALVHFRIDEDGDVGEDDVSVGAFGSSVDKLRPLEVRIFDLGLQQDVSPLPPAVFPTMLKQMKALTTNKGAYAIEEEYHELMRSYHQFNHHEYFPACNRQGSFLDYTSEFDNFLLKKVAAPVGLEEAADIMNGVAFTVSLTFGVIYYQIANFIGGLWSDFFGQPKPLDHLAERLEEREAVIERGGFLGDMQHGFVNWLEDYLESSAAESAEQPVVTTQNEDIKSAFAGLRANMSSIGKGA